LCLRFVLNYLYDEAILQRDESKNLARGLYKYVHIGILTKMKISLVDTSRWKVIRNPLNSFKDYILEYAGGHA
jgi:hypothetical protein